MTENPSGSRRLQQFALPVILALVVAGTSAAFSAAPSVGGTPLGALVPITQRGIAAVALDYAPAETSSRAATYTDQRHRPGTLGADFRYHAGGDSDGDLLRTVVMPARADFSCPPGSHCMQLFHGQPEPVFLYWQKLAPEEDPGIVYVVANHDGEQTASLYSGPDITANPLKLDLEIPVDVLVDIVTDPRLRLQTTQDVVDAGVALTGWSGGEPDPYSYQRVPQTDIGQVNGWLIYLRGLRHYANLAPSPLKSGFAPDTIGGRVERTEVTGIDPSMIDVLATQQPPAWLAEDPCARPRFAGHCSQTRGKRGPIVLMWRPASSAGNGVVWAAQLRETEVVAFRFVGGPIPSAQGEVEKAIRWRGVRYALASRRLGMRTYKMVVDFELPAR
jgi:hypothetical protein